jgi:hypothetical protein
MYVWMWTSEIVYFRYALMLVKVKVCVYVYISDCMNVDV